MGMGIHRKRVNIKGIGNEGSTMIETVVSFVVLVMVLAGLYGVVLFSSNLYMKSVDTSRLQQRFYRELYKKDLTSNAFITITEYESGSGFDGTDYDGKHVSLILSLDKEKTDLSNYGTHEDDYIIMDRIGVNSYVCSDESIETLQLIAPKAIQFVYDAP